MTSLADMTPDAVAAWVKSAARVLIDKAPHLAVETLGALEKHANDRIAAAYEDDKVSDAHTRRDRIKRTIEMVAIRHCVTVPALLGDSRKSHLVEARYAAAEKLREMGMSWPRVATILNYKDHTTVMNAVKRRQQERGT